MKRIFSILFTLFAAASLFSETLLLYPAANLGVEQTSRIDKECLDALQDGIMTVFFNNDRIIFNTSLEPDVSDIGAFHEKAMKMAKNGGASHLLETLIQYAPVSGDVDTYALPAAVQFELIDIYEETTIVKGTLKPSDMGFRLDGAPKDLSFSLGQMIGMRVFGNMNK